MPVIHMNKVDLRILKQILSKYPYPFYAYGSRVKGKAKQYSDLDLCYQGDIPWNTLDHIQEELEESDLPFKVELNAWKWMSREFQKLIEKDLTLI